jgi:thiol-disulfide isomerase/thioredoxin
MISARVAAAAIAAVCVAAPLYAQSLGEIARRAEEARKASARPAVVYDERDMNPALARRDVLDFRLDDRTWKQFVRADSAVRAVAATDSDLVRRLEGLNYVTIRSVGRFFERETAVATALQSAAVDPHQYANTYLALKLAFSDSVDALADAPQHNRAFLGARAAQTNALALPLDAFSLHALVTPVRRATASATTSPRPSEPAAGAPLPSAIDRPGARAEMDAASGVIDMTVGAHIPDFDFVDFDGRRRQLSDFKGKYLLLDFWGSWCPPCRAEVPFVREAYAAFGSRGFEVLGMDHERSATLAQVRDYLSSNGVRWTFAAPDSVRSLINDRFQITSFPRVILLDPDGRVIEARNDALRGRNLARTLDRLLPK